MDLYFADYSKILASSHDLVSGRVVLITFPYPESFEILSRTTEMIVVDNLVIQDGESRNEVESRYGKINWDDVVKILKSGDIIAGKGTHVHMFLKHLSNAVLINESAYDCTDAERCFAGEDIEHIKNDGYKDVFGYRLEGDPKTPIFDQDGYLIPFLDAQDNLIIPFNSKDVYKYWKEKGMKLEEVLDTFIKDFVTSEEYDALKKKYCTKFGGSNCL